MSEAIAERAAIGRAMDTNCLAKVLDDESIMDGEPAEEYVEDRARVLVLTE